LVDVRRRSDEVLKRVPAVRVQRTNSFPLIVAINLAVCPSFAFVSAA
jgi:hypothetical protein